MVNNSSSLELDGKAGYVRLFDALAGNNLLLEANPPTFTILAATPQRLQDVGMTKEATIGKPLFEVYPGNPTDPTDNGVRNLRSSLDHVLRYKEIHELPVQRYDLPDEQGGFSEKYWRAGNRPVFNYEGEVAYIIHTAQDITHEIKARRQEERLKFTEQAYGLFMQAPFAIHIFTGPDLIIDMANPLTLELWGKTEDPTGKRFLEVLPELKGQGYDVLMHEVMETGKPRHFYEVALALNRPGKESIGYFNLIYQPYYKEENTKAESVLIIANEVTQQVLAKKQASESEQSLSLAVEIAELGIFKIDLVTSAGTYSQQIIDWFGIDSPPLSMTKIFARVHPEDQPTVAETLKRSSAGEWGGHHDFVYRVTDPQTGAIRYLRSIGQVQWEKGQAVAIYGIIQDVSPQVKAKQRIEEEVIERTKELAAANQSLSALNKELQRSNQNLEEFAHAASHDLKEPIRKIHFFTNQLKDQLNPHLKETELRSFTRIESATNRMSNLIDDLLLYSHVSQRPHEKEAVDLNIKVQNVLEELELDIEEKKAVIHSGELPIVQGYRRQLQQLFQNLLSNALKYSKADEPPQITISASQTTEGEKTYHLIFVKDNGIGFDQQYADKIFQMFSRLHSRSEYSGTGVGLSIVKKVAENHNGFIRVESKQGQGSIFTIYLPV